MYIKIENDKLTDWAEWQFEGSTFIDIDKKDYDDNKDRYQVVDGVLVDISTSDEYLKKKRLEDIEIELQNATTDYVEALNEPIAYSNGFTYLPKYAQETYMTLLSSEQVMKALNPSLTNFPQYIKDSTKLDDRAVMMSYAELGQLTLFLAQKAQILWKTKADKEALLLAEKESILNPPIITES